MVHANHALLLLGLLALPLRAQAKAGETCLYAGLGSAYAWNFVGVAREWHLDGHFGVYVTAGLGEMLVGVGGIWHANRQGDGWVASVVGGTGLQSTLAYRFRTGQRSFLTLGATYIPIFGFSNQNHPGLLPTIAYQHRFGP